MKNYSEPIQFEWDAGNKDKNLSSHQVTKEECEEIFFDPKKKMSKDTLHSADEERHIVIGKSKKNRLLFLVFTLKNKRLRVISARDLNKRERHLYEEKT